MQYVVEDFMDQCVTAYKDLFGEPDMKLRAVETPFLVSPEGWVMALSLLLRVNLRVFCSLSLPVS